MKALLLLTVCTLSTLANAQFGKYNFEVRNDAFVPLQHATIILADTFWIAESYKNSGFELGSNSFSFPFEDEEINDIILTPRATPKTYGAGLDMYGDSFFVYMKIGGFAIRELADAPPYKSKISYLIDSSNSQERFFKIELLRVGVADSNDITVGEINVQIWLSSKGRVEFHYGQCNVPGYAFYYKRQVKHNSGINNYNYKAGQSPRHSIFAVGDPFNPRIYKLDSLEDISLFNDSTLDVYPNNVVHAYYIGNIGIKETTQDGYATIFPNPVISTLFINTSEEITQVGVFDIVGTQLLQTTESSIDCSSLKTGVYFMKIETDKGFYLKKICKID